MLIVTVYASCLSGALSSAPDVKRQSVLCERDASKIVFQATRRLFAASIEVPVA
jgi:hypothetical protein